MKHQQTKDNREIWGLCWNKNCCPSNDIHIQFKNHPPESPNRCIHTIWLSGCWFLPFSWMTFQSIKFLPLITPTILRLTDPSPHWSSLSTLVLAVHLHLRWLRHGEIYTLFILFAIVHFTTLAHFLRHVAPVLWKFHSHYDIKRQSLFLQEYLCSDKLQKDST